MKVPVRESILILLNQEEEVSFFYDYNQEISWRDDALQAVLGLEEGYTYKPPFLFLRQLNEVRVWHLQQLIKDLLSEGYLFVYSPGEMEIFTTGENMALHQLKDRLHPLEVEHFEEILEKNLSPYQEASQSMVLRLLVDGRYCYYELKVYGIRTLTETVLLYGQYKDITTAYQRNVVTLLKTKVIDEAKRAILFMDQDFTITYASKAYLEDHLIGPDIIGQSYLKLLKEGKLYSLDKFYEALEKLPHTGHYSYVPEKGKYLEKMSTFKQVLSPDGVSYFLIEDATIQLFDQGQSSSGTHLPEVVDINHVKEELTTILDGCPRDEDVAIVLISIDQFRNFNSIYGVEMGHELVRYVQLLLLELFNDSIVYPISREDFLVILPQITYHEPVEQEIGKLLDLFNKPIILNQVEVLCSISVGIAFYPDNGYEAEELLRNVYTALVRAKRKFGNSLLNYSDAFQGQMVWKQKIESLVQEAVSHNHVFLEFQPIFTRDGARIKSIEALVRIREGNEVVSPGIFIPIAERLAIMRDLEEIILTKAIAAQEWLQENGILDLPIAINVTPSIFRGEEEFGLLDDALSKISFSPALLTVEITERLFIEDEEGTIAKLKRLKNKGVRISLDDFGTGYSSLNYLRKLPLDTVKIDKSFIDDYQSAESKKIVKTILELSKVLGFETIAEGVETKEQVAYLQAMNCSLMQGYYFARPMQLEAIKSLYEQTMSTKKR